MLLEFQPNKKSPLLVTSYYLTEQKHRLCHKLVVPYFNSELSNLRSTSPLQLLFQQPHHLCNKLFFGGESELPKKHTHDWVNPQQRRVNCFFR